MHDIYRRILELRNLARHLSANIVKTQGALTTLYFLVNSVFNNNGDFIPMFIWLNIMFYSGNYKFYFRFNETVVNHLLSGTAGHSPTCHILVKSSTKVTTALFFIIFLK